MKYLDLAKAALKRHALIHNVHEVNELRARNEERQPRAHGRTEDDEKNEVNEIRRGTSDVRSESREDRLDLPALIAWFQAIRGVLPRSPFMLRPGCRVIDSERYYARLDDDISRGESSVRWKAGLSADLESLRRVVKGRCVEQ
jgi:hypothetical protein